MSKINVLVVTNLGWIVAILTALLIGNLSVDWAKISELPNIISIALGLSSLLLALIAIIQSFTSTTNLTRSLGDVSGVAERARQATENVFLASKELVERADQFGSMHKDLGELRRQFDNIANSASSKTNDPRPKEKDSDSSTENYHVDVFNKGTIGLTISFYIANKSATTNRSFNPEDIFPGDEFSQYVSGALLAARALGAIDTQVIDGVYYVQDMRDYDKKTIDKWIEWTEKVEDFPTMISQIDKYFENRKADA